MTLEVPIIGRTLDLHRALTLPEAPKGQMIYSKKGIPFIRASDGKLYVPVKNNDKIYWRRQRSDAFFPNMSPARREALTRWAEINRSIRGRSWDIVTRDDGKVVSVPGGAGALQREFRGFRSTLPKTDKKAEVVEARQELLERSLENQPEMTFDRVTELAMLLRG